MQLNWFSITRLGEAGLLLPLALALLLGLALMRAHSLCAQFALRLLLATIITLASKIAFFAAGLGISAIDFIGFSGHTLLSTAILPVLSGWVLVNKEGYFSKPGIALGLFIAAIIGWSRLEVNAHSSSEVITGWLLGYMVIHPFWKARIPKPSPLKKLIPLSLTAIIFTLWANPQTALHIPSYTWEQDIAKWLMGQERVYTRHDLHNKPTQ
ncbi:phosphatase PAP2 family protein [Iodobacter ciconiae]|uniref:Phosphatase PAP2 family protein n=1 Tax=Iodobacter ciconiae TaxID=2496266 RepID=A0A3S8ZP61_9NEIS|nr:phosphatase PAP2 family protein [Iodobacter ciconiae]AZN35161.1 phosphatase PAP2 family protein [Iodobacter ciconiae]